MLLAAAEATAQQGSIVQALLPFVILLVVFWFILWRPQQQQQKKRREMLSALKKGDKVVTIGGIHGEVVAFTDDTVTLRIAEKVEVKMNRSGIGSIKS